MLFGVAENDLISGAPWPTTTVTVRVSGFAPVFEALSVNEVFACRPEMTLLPVGGATSPFSRASPVVFQWRVTDCPGRILEGSARNSAIRGEAAGIAAAD